MRKGKPERDHGLFVRDLLSCTAIEAVCSYYQSGVGMSRYLVILMMLVSATSMAEPSAWEKTREGSKQVWSGVKQGSSELWGDVKEGSRDAWSATRDERQAVEDESKGLWQTIKDAFSAD